MRHWKLSTVICVNLLLLTASLASAAKPDALVRLPGHVLPALSKATLVDVKSTSVAEEPLTLTLVLKHEDQAGFDRYLREVYDPKSPNYRKFLTQSELSDRFGPSRKAYEGLLSYLQDKGFTLVEGSANRQTLIVRGSRFHVEHIFAIRIGDYKIGDRTFYANDADPALPAAIARRVQAVGGLSDLARPKPVGIKKGFAKFFCGWEAEDAGKVAEFHRAEGRKPKTECEAAADKCVAGWALSSADDTDAKNWIKSNKCSKFTDPPTTTTSSRSVSAALLALGVSTMWKDADGTGQTVGITAFDTFNRSDVADYFELFGVPDAVLGKLSQVHVNGGASPGANQAEVLLDINTVLIAAPGASTVVYDAPFTGTGSFQALFSRMIGDGVTIISNSWAYCEDQTTLADVQSIDTLLATAAASGISVFNATGDTGSTCLNGSPNTVAVPASSPNATAVGGTSLISGPVATYESETWWDGTSNSPPTGQGGFGLSRFFARPTYQDGFHGSPMRSVPDVAFNSDPARGIVICQASAGGCPSPYLWGGTSVAAPTWAATTALLNQALGQNLGNLNPLIYPLANSGAFHTPASIGSDFAHVGLGSPKFNALLMAFMGTTPGPVSAIESEVRAQFATISADGTSTAQVVVRLRDAAGNTVRGKTVALTANTGSGAVITPATGVSNEANGAVIFSITNLTPGAVTFTATDTSDGIVLDQQVTVTFVVPSATSGGITASPTPVTANGIATTTITVILRDALNRPTPGKEVRLSQGTGHSVITGPNPPVTDSNGQIQFTATNLFNETITYTAVDVTDGDLPVPGSAVVTFSNSTNLCPSPAPVPTGENGYVVAPFATGFVSRPLSFGGITYGGCPGVSTPAFLDNGVFFTDWTGDAIKLPATGGAVTNANRLANVGQTLAWPVVSKGGKLYAARASTGSGISGVIIEINPTTGVVVRTLASGLSCPFSLVVDPLSGDLFFDGGCDGSFTDPRVRRIRNPDSATPTLEDYVTLPASPNGKMSFAPDGTLYVVTGYFNAAPTILRVSGTNVPGTPTVTTVPGVNSVFWVNIGEVGSNGTVRSLLTLAPVTFNLELVDITTNPPTKTVLAKNIGGGEIGPDGCLYAPIETVIYRLTDSTGSCSFASATPRPSLTLTPTIISPNPAQGTTQTFTATFRNLNVPVNTPVFFFVTGANDRFQLVRTNANGEAVLTYTATSPGKDTVEATATINNETLTSNKAQVTWTAGKHVTFLSLNPSPTSGTPGQPVTVVASLTDSSVDPTASVVGVAVTFTLGSAQCVGTTNGNGIASCTLVPSVVGMGTLNASFAGNTQFVTSSDSVGFNVLAAASSCIPATEVCDGQDKDCDSEIDEGLGTLSCGVGTCARTANACVNGIPQTCTPGAPSAEVCDGQDNSCNGQIDDGLGTLSCGVGACARTVNACVDGSSQTCTPGTPTAEICGDGIDQDCNGADALCPPPPPTAQCPLSHGYWKNHPAVWPVTSLQLGTQTYSKTELLTLLGKPSQGDASVILAHQLIAAKLNLAAGVNGQSIAATITDADQRLSTFTGKLPYEVKPSSTAGKGLVKAAEKLEDFNDGELTPRCDNDDDDGEKKEKSEKRGTLSML